MSNLTLKWLVTILGFTCLSLAILCGFLNYQMEAQVEVAEDYSKNIEEMRIHALQSTGRDEIVNYLFGVSVYCHKHKTVSPLDPLVERQRAAAVREIVAHLRRTSGEDLGEKPESWIGKYFWKEKTFDIKKKPDS